MTIVERFNLIIEGIMLCLLEQIAGDLTPGRVKSRLLKRIHAMLADLNREFAAAVAAVNAAAEAAECAAQIASGTPSQIPDRSNGRQPCRRAAQRAPAMPPLKTMPLRRPAVHFALAPPKHRRITYRQPRPITPNSLRYSNKRRSVVPRPSKLRICVEYSNSRNIRRRSFVGAQRRRGTSNARI